jgi:hypothetical protein
MTFIRLSLPPKKTRRDLNHDGFVWIAFENDTLVTVAPRGGRRAFRGYGR